MAGINKVILIGNLGKDPEVKHFESGSMVVNFSIATSESYKDKKSGEKITQTEWHNISIWREGLAKIAETYLKKGSSVYIEGKLRTRSWDDKDGNKRYTTEVVADNMTMLGGRSDSGQAQGESNANNSGAFEDDSSGDLPF
ncbi:MAG: single-stranded DNA-binding protein [Flavobacteriales bacterium]